MTKSRYLVLPVDNAWFCAERPGTWSDFSPAWGGYAVQLFIHVQSVHQHDSRKEYALFLTFLGSKQKQKALLWSREAISQKLRLFRVSNDFPTLPTLVLLKQSLSHAKFACLSACLNITYQTTAESKKIFQNIDADARNKSLFQSQSLPGQSLPGGGEFDPHA